MYELTEKAAASEVVDSQFSLRGRRALVTAGCGGFGVEISRGLATAGASLLLTDIQREQGELLAEQLTDQGHSAFFRYCDCSDKAQVGEAVDSAVKLLGGLDLLVHVACA